MHTSKIFTNSCMEHLLGACWQQHAQVCDKDEQLKRQHLLFLAHMLCCFLNRLRRRRGPGRSWLLQKASIALEAPCDDVDSKENVMQEPAASSARSISASA